MLTPFINVGHVPSAQTAATQSPRTPPPAVDLVTSRARQKLIRDFADSLGLRSDDGQRPIYRTESGGYYYPYKLMKMYEAHLSAETRRGEQ